MAENEAIGIHAHPTMKLGLRPPKNAPALMLKDVLSGNAIEHPLAADHFNHVQFTMGANDRFGVCGPTGVCNLVRLVSTALLGTPIQPTLNDEFDLYRRSGNPNFNPNLEPNDPQQQDQGVDLQTMLEALLAGGIGDGKGGTIKPLCFAKIESDDTATLDAGVSIFGGLLWGVALEEDQQQQTQEQPPRWDYSESPDWGGHCVMNGKYDEAQKIADVISWNEDVMTTDPFRQNQLQEAWAVIWPWNVAHPAFQQGIDVAALIAAYKDLTGADLPVTPPSPTGSIPRDAADEALVKACRRFMSRPTFVHRDVQDALNTWAAVKGMGLTVEEQAQLRRL